MDRQYSLTGQFLLAMPGIGDPRFERSVIAICAHDSAGAFGLCLHAHVAELSVPEMMRELDIDPRATPSVPVLRGGPVEPQRGFVLHTPDWSEDGTRPVAGRWALTGTRDVLAAIAEGQGPRQWIVALGYAGWGVNQLDSELLRHGWLTTPASEALLWDTPAAERWVRGFAAEGIDPAMLVADAGHA